MYGQDPGLCKLIENRGVGYVLAIAANRRLRVDGVEHPVSDIAAGVPAWQRYSAGDGTKGPRWYAWAWKRIDTDRPGRHWLLIRRNVTTGELAFYRCFAPRPVPLATLVRVAGSRWAIEELFQAAKGQVGLGHYQIRGWTGWHRHITLAMLALAFLAVVALTSTTGPQDRTNPLTIPEIRRQLSSIVFISSRRIEDILRWSHWRRHHQHKARQSHYQRRSRP